MASIFDPIQGHQTSLHGQFLSQFAAYLFMASGAFLVFLDLLLTSYTVWPVMSFFPDIKVAGIHLFVGQFSYLMTAALLLAAPAIVIMLIIDLSFGLVNRYAPSLNVFALPLPIKTWLSTAVILLMIGALMDFVLQRLGDSRGFLDVLQKAFSASGAWGGLDPPSGLSPTPPVSRRMPSAQCSTSATASKDPLPL